MRRTVLGLGCWLDLLAPAACSPYSFGGVVVFRPAGETTETAGS